MADRRGHRGLIPALPPAHELGHAIAARRAGLPGGPVVLYFFGGAATPSLVATRARDEVVVALAGPAVSLAAVESCCS
ncbi:MAG: hypothetical protein WKF78_14390 [Candidatus Limnocylindrales bacterium]